jgi:putative salt-induced outer membrane protein YdiY
MRDRRRYLWFLSLISAAVLPRTALAQTPPAPAWSYQAKLTAVWAGGNTESSTFGLGSSLRRTGELVELKLEAGAIRTDASVKTRRATGTSSTYQLTEQETHQKTAENYFVRFRSDRKMGGRVVIFAGADWLRNTFAGIDSRMLIATGGGTSWVNREDFRVRTDLGATYTFQQDVVENPFGKSKFPGLRFSADLLRTLTQTTKWESALIYDQNIDQTDDARIDFTNSLSLAISSRIALNPSLQLLWRNQPALTEVDLFSSLGAATGEKVQVPLEKLDSFFTLAVVITL